MAISNAVNLASIASDDTLTVDTSNDRVGVGSTTPTESLDVVGVVSATSFFGDGSNLSGITAGATLSAGSGDQRVVVTSLTSGTMTAAATDAELTYNSGTNTLSATTFSGDVTGNVTGTAATFSGNVSVGGVLIFAGLTAWDTQRIKSMYLAGDSSEVAAKKSIFGALTLYLDFINMFLFILRLFGNRE